MELLDDPRELCGWRVVQPVADRLRTGPLDLRVPHAGLAELLVVGEAFALAVGQRCDLGRVVAGDRHERVDVHADHAFGSGAGHLGCDEGARVAALDAEAFVVQHAHQLQERARDPAIGPARLRDRPGEAVAG